MISAIKEFWKTYIVVDRVFLSRQRFKRDDKELGLRLNYPLTAKSVVFDLGGYMGEWTEEIWQRYHSKVFVFEPVKEFYNHLQEKFKDNPDVMIFNYGLSDKNERAKISLAKDASRVGENGAEIELRDIAEVIKDLHIEKIDLIKINIEGGEYQVLPRLIESSIIESCQDVQVQFHDFYPDAKRKREAIRQKLIRTHHLTYDYPFTFENWRKND